MGFFCIDYSDIKKSYKNYDVSINYNTYGNSVNKNHLSEKILYLGNKEKPHCPLELAIYDGDEKCKDVGQLSIFQYDSNTKSVNYVTQEEFLYKVFNNDRKICSEVIQLIKTRLNSLKDRPHRPEEINMHSDVEHFMTFFIDKTNTNIRFILPDIKEKNVNHFFIFGLNINKEYITQAISPIIDPYQPVEIIDDEEEFMISDSSTEFFHIVYRKTYTKEQIGNIIKQYIANITDEKFKKEELKIVQEYIRFYPDYYKYYYVMNGKLKQIVQGIKTNFIKNNKIKMPYNRTEQEQQLWDSYSKQRADIYTYDNNSEYNLGIVFERLINKMRIRLSYKQKTIYKTHLPLILFSLKMKQKENEIVKTLNVDARIRQYLMDKKLKENYSMDSEGRALCNTLIRQDIYDFIKQNTNTKKRFYITFKDKNNNTYLDNTPYKIKNLSREGFDVEVEDDDGHYITRLFYEKIHEISYFEKNKRKYMSKQNIDISEGQI